VGARREGRGAGERKQLPDHLFSATLTPENSFYLLIDAAVPADVRFFIPAPINRFGKRHSQFKPSVLTSARARIPLCLVVLLRYPSRAHKNPLSLQVRLVSSRRCAHINSPSTHHPTHRRGCYSPCSATVSPVTICGLVNSVNFRHQCPGACLTLKMGGALSPSASTRLSRL